MLADEELDSDILQRYRTLDLLGKGAYGIVWKAEERRSGRVVALKKIIGAFNNDVDSQRTYREVFILQNIRHKHIVRLLNVHRADNDLDLYLIFEYMHTDLCQLIYEKRLTDDQRVFIAFQIFSGLLFLESLGVLHRDLKPANILVDADCNVKIADFGLARTIHESVGSVQPIMTEYVATKLYRAPEIMLGSNVYSFPVDMWSAGCILAEVFMRKPTMLLYSQNIVEQLMRYFAIFGKPGEADLDSVTVAGPLSIMRHLSASEATPLAQVLDRQDKDLLDLITKCLHFNPAKRLTPVQAIEHAFFRNTKISGFLQGLVVYKSQFRLAPILREEVKLNAVQYRRELYRLVLEKKHDTNLKQKTVQSAVTHSEMKD